MTTHSHCAWTNEGGHVIIGGTLGPRVRVITAEHHRALWALLRGLMVCLGKAWDLLSLEL